MLKKTVAFVLAAILVMMTCGAGSADNERTSGLYTYEFKGNGTVVITGFDWKHNSDNIYIPALIDGYPVTGIGERAFALPDDSAAKGNYVVTLSGGITTIGDFAFQNAPVSTINIPDSTTFIGIGAFLVTPNYIHINVAPTHGTFATIDGVLFNKAKRELLAFPSRRLDDGKIYNIPDGIVSIADYAFYGVSASSSGKKPQISISKTVSSIGRYAFANCQADIIIQNNNNIAALGEGAFAGQIITAGNTKTFKGARVTGIQYLDKLAIIPSHCFAGISFTDSSSEKFVIPSNITEIQEYAFSGFWLYRCKLFTLVIPGHVVTVGPHAFEDFGRHDVNLQKIHIKSGVQSIGDYAFSGIFNLELLTIDEGLQSIGAGAFSRCEKLKEATIPSSVTSIGANCFNKTITTLTVVQGSYAEQYAIENGIQFKYAESEDNLSWLYGASEASETKESTDWLNP